MVALLGLYLASIISFGSIYYWIFLDNPEYYIFSSALAEGRAVQKFESELHNLLGINNVLYALSVVDGSPTYIRRTLSSKISLVNGRAKEHAPTDGFFEIGSGFRIRLREDIVGGSGAGWHVLYFLDVVGPDGTVEFGHENPFHPRSRALSELFEADTYARFRPALRQLIRVAMDEREVRLRELRGLLLAQPEWDYTDFLYFSAITQTTVGYGDIAPNSPTVRVVVLINTIVGVFLLGFALIFIWPKEIDS